MRVYGTHAGLPPDARGAVVAVGNFDGVHRGHQALLAAARAVAEAEGRPPAALTFEPHPRAVLRPDDPPGRLTPAPLKHHRLEAQGVETLYSLPFDWEVASLPPEAFVRDILVRGLASAHVVVGADFRFGQIRAGTPADIRAAGLPVTAVDKAKDGGEPISASRIRGLLRHGHMDEAAALLGWAWEVWGEVVRGDQRGRDLGYPTANMSLGPAVHPAYGVYAGQVLLPGEAAWRAAALNIGIRPMFALPVAQVEAHILDFEGDLYGQVLRVRPVARLRGEARFASLDALVAQMALDCDQARAVLAGRPGPG